MRVKQPDSGCGVLGFISSIGANGGETHGKPFTIDSEVAPHTPLAQFEIQAENGIRRLASESGMEVVIVRPPRFMVQMRQATFRSS